MTREEIGSYLGSARDREPLFSRFQEEGLIQVQGRAVKIVDMAAMRHLVGQKIARPPPGAKAAAQVAPAGSAPSTIDFPRRRSKEHVSADEAIAIAQNTKSRPYRSPRARLRRLPKTCRSCGSNTVKKIPQAAAATRNDGQSTHMSRRAKVLFSVMVLLRDWRRVLGDPVGRAACANGP